MPASDGDASLLVDALADAGVDAIEVAWDEPIDWSSFRLVLLRTPWDYVERANAFLAWVDSVAAVARLRNPAPVVRWNAHKRYLFDLENAGVPIVPTRQVAQFCPWQFQRAVLRRFDGDVVIKPAVSIGARATELLPADSIEAAAHLETLALLGDVLVQPVVDSVTTSGEVSMMFLAGEYSHAVRKVPAAGDFRVHQEYGGALHDHAPTDAEMGVALAALEVVEQDLLYARVDLVALADGPAVMELELIDPELFLRRSEGAVERYASLIVRALSERPTQ
jgi:glutathione synthase/RimK-type ligase-like ATP-grasp enzyme